MNRRSFLGMLSAGLAALKLGPKVEAPEPRMVITAIDQETHTITVEWEPNGLRNLVDDGYGAVYGIVRSAKSLIRRS